MQNILPTILGPIVRNGLRVAAGAMIGIGFSEETAGALNNEVMIGFATLVLSEGWYLLAKRFNWRT